MDEHAPLHPNLAKIAAAYRQIHLRWADGEIDATEARQRIASLVARDDQGVQWRIDPSTGQWERQMHDRSWGLAHPPTFGVQTLSASDVSHIGPGADVADEHVRSFTVDEEALLPPDEVVGSTRRIHAHVGDSHADTGNPRPWVLVGVLAFAVAVLAFLLLA